MSDIFSIDPETICIIPGCDRPRDKKQNRRICMLHRSRKSKYKSYEIPPKDLPEGIIKRCKMHGDLKIDEVKYRFKDKLWVSCKYCLQRCEDSFIAAHGRSKRNTYKKNMFIWNGKIKLPIKTYEEMLLKQNNVCAICNQPETAKHQKDKEGFKKLAVDHCHTTGIIRGLLCQKCNISIGAMNDSIENMKAAIKYLEYHQKI
jgi:hypothetical protein